VARTHRFNVIRSHFSTPPGRHEVPEQQNAAYMRAMAIADRRRQFPSWFRRRDIRWLRNRANHLLRTAAAHSELDDFEMPRLRYSAAYMHVLLRPDARIGQADRVPRRRPG
jgi:hypothetical protein